LNVLCIEFQALIFPFSLFSENLKVTIGIIILYKLFKKAEKAEKAEKEI